MQLVQIISVGGTNVRAAGRIALNGTAEDVREFLEVGQFVARAKDQEHATVAQLAAQAKEAGRQAAKETAAAKAQSAKAVQAGQLAKEAALKAASEAEAAKDAEASAASAAASAKRAWEAANSADLAAEDAARSAADATLSSEMAQASASQAWYHADQARQSAIEAGKDAQAAAKAATEAFTIAVTKYREEKEARRKAAIEAKQKALNDPGVRARKMYRCESGYIPCDPVEMACWCQHGEILCGIIGYGDEFGAAMEDLWGATKELTGLTELEACLDEKNFDHCSSLAADVLISAKLKALEKAYDGMTLEAQDLRPSRPVA